MIQTVIMLIVALFVLYEIVKIMIFLHVAIGRVKEKKHEREKFPAEDACYQKQYIESQEWLLQQNAEEIRICGHRNTQLIGHYLPAENPQRILLAFHGWRSNWKKDFSLCAKSFQEQGCSILLVEQRAHGRSGGKHIGFGILERYDCKYWAEYLYKTYGKDMPIYLYGMSMGASTVLMASSLKLPQNVKGVIADCGFTTPYKMLVRSAHEILKEGEYPDVPIIDKLCTWIAGYSFREYSTLEAMKVSKLPTFFIHGLKDRFVPYYMTLENYHMCVARKELLLVDGADHCRSYFMQPETYMGKIRKFFNW